jgi:hypothetical protein
MVSSKQLDANRRNAMKSTGPKTPEGKARVRFNALEHGLRARSILIPGEDAEEFRRLCDDLDCDWQPQTRTECLHIEQMAINTWLLRRLDIAEGRVYLEKNLRPERVLALLGSVSVLRRRLEQSFSKTMHELEYLQKHRPVTHDERPEQTQTQTPATPLSAPFTAPPALMSDSAADTR